MKRQIITINQDLCNGCGLCVPNCHEGALQIIDGKARLIGDHFCDGLGACLGHCPEGAITIETREAAAYTEAAVPHPPHEGGCPGSRAISFGSTPALSQWPIQMHLLNPRSAHFTAADFLLAADCTAFALGSFHPQLLAGKKLGIACPKLDSSQETYRDKLVALIDEARINTLTVAIMEVPCCGGLLALAQQALQQAKRTIPLKKVVVGIEGGLISEDWL